jgi:hypothetical protein
MIMAPRRPNTRGKRLAIAAAGTIGVLLALAGLSMLILRVVPPRVLYSRQAHTTEALMRRVEAFKAAHGRLPSRVEMGFSEEGPIYEPEPDGGYIIGFSVGFDENYYIDNRTEQWNW